MTPRQRPPRSKALLDAIEAERPKPLAATVWRVVNDGFDPLRPSRAGGRWDDGTFDVLYTSTMRDGALAESWFHATQGQPIPPSKIRKRLFQIEVNLNRVLDLATVGKLTILGVDVTKFGRLHYLERADEYPALQQIGEVAFFYDYEALIVPSARWPAANVVIMTEHIKTSQLDIAGDELVDLGAWNRLIGARRLP